MSKLQLYVIIFGAVATIIGSIWLHGYSVGKQSVKVKVLEKTVTKIEEREDLEREVITLDRADLVARFCEWVRDDKISCLQADIPIP
jgi:hypothetical protein